MDTTDDTEAAGDPSPSNADPIRSIRTIVLSLLGIGILGIGLWLTAGVLGLIATAAIGLGWYRLSELYAVAIGHAALLWVVPPVSLSEVTLSPELLIGEAGLLVVLLAPAADTDAPGSVVVATIAVLILVVAISAGSYWWGSELWITAGVLVGTLLVGGYTLYRYELVRLDLVDRGETT